MRVAAVVAAIVAALGGAPGFAADAGMTTPALETWLLDSGFVAVAEAPFEFTDIDYENDSAFKIGGTASRPMLENTWCGPPEPLTSFLFKTGSLTYLVENKGEWGGSLSVQKGDAEPQTLVRENITSLWPDGDRLMVFTGLEHGDSVGGVYVIDHFKSQPSARQLTRLPEAPRAIVEQKREFLPSTFIVVGERSIAAVDSNYRFDVHMAGHALPAPTSALVDGAHIYVGICGGVADVYLPWHSSRPSSPIHIPLIRYWVPRTRTGQ
jgi:hypothetical protein